MSIIENLETPSDIAAGGALAPGRGERPPEVPVVEVFGISIANLRVEQFLAWVERRIASGQPGFVCTPNINHVVRLQHDEALQAAYRSAALSIADGTPLIWAARLLGKRIVQKLSGSDMVPRMCELARDNDRSVYFFGAREGVGAQAAAIMQAAYPGLRVAGVHSPPLGFESNPDLHQDALDGIRAANPDILFVALGCPKQEIWLAAHCEEMGVPVGIGIGATFDFIAGHVRRAPQWMQRAGLEWLWRVMQEPRRLIGRYSADAVGFTGIFIREWCGGRHRP